MERHTSRPDQSGHTYFNDSPDALAVMMDARSKAFVARARRASSAAHTLVDRIDRIVPQGNDAAPAPGPAGPEQDRAEDLEQITQLPARRRLAGTAIFFTGPELDIGEKPDENAA